MAARMHSKVRETQCAISFLMPLYAKTRKGLLVEMLHEYGLSIPYARMFEVSAPLGDAAKVDICRKEYFVRQA